MKLEAVFAAARDAVTVRRVFGEPFEKDGATIIPAAVVSGGAGGGSGQDDQGQEGEGGGFGFSARPAGAYVVADGSVRWRPAVDVNRVVVVVGVIAVVYLLGRARTARILARAGREA